MANNHSTLTGLFTDIADAIRAKTGGTESIVADAFPEAIGAIEAGGGTDTEAMMVFRTFSGALSNDVYSCVGSHAFGDCKSLTEVALPACTSIGAYAFYSCTALRSISFPVCASINSSAFAGCNKIVSASFPEAIRISDYAFASCTSLQSVYFPKVSSLGNYAFNSCSALVACDFPKASTMGSQAFRNCTTLATVSLGNIKNISVAAFNGCKALMSLYLTGSTVPSLGNANAFSVTPMSLSSYTGAFGSIYVPASLLASYKKATNWSYFSSRFVGV